MLISIIVLAILVVSAVATTVYRSLIFKEYG